MQKFFNTAETKQQIIDGYLRSRDNTYNSIQKSKTELSKLVANDLELADLGDPDNELFVFINQLPNN